MLRKKYIYFLILVVVLGLQGTTLDANQTCSESIVSLVPCLPFLQGYGLETLSQYCCGEINHLFQKANTPEIRRNLCQCLKNASKRFEIKSDQAKQLPQLCNIYISFSIDPDPNIDCNT